MDTAISFTFGQLLAVVAAVCGTITSVAAAVAVLSKAIKKAREPNTLQDERIARLEARADKVDGLLDNDNRRLQALETEGRITQRALLALLKHGINGNDTAAMEASMKEIEKYLIER